MFVSKSRHESAVNLLNERIKALQELLELRERASGEVAEAYQKQIQTLQSLLFVPKQEAAPEIREADSVMSGSEKHFEMTEEEHTKLLQGERELDLIISGNYSEDWLNG